MDKFRIFGNRYICYDFLALAGIPHEVFDHKVGNRSAIDWIIDRYQVHVDKRSGIVNDPNRPDDTEYIVSLSSFIASLLSCN